MQRFAGGVFAVIRGKPDKVWHSLAGKGMPSYIAPSGTTYMLMYNPQHLLGVEAPLSIMSAVRLGKSTGAQPLGTDDCLASLVLRPLCLRVLRRRGVPRAARGARRGCGPRPQRR